jgi:hypothetical protein
MTVNEAFQEGLLSGLRLGSEVLRVRRTDHATLRQGGVRLKSFNLTALAADKIRDALASDNPALEEVTDASGEWISPDRVAFDLDLSTRDSGSTFKMAAGVAATCDKCGKILSIGNGWYHLSSIAEDLCGEHLSKLPPSARGRYCSVDSEDVLGANRSKYMLKIRVAADVFPQGRQAALQAEGKVVLEVSHLVNPKGDETLSSMLKPLVPRVNIEECEGPRHFCRIKVEMKDEAAVREVIKSLVSSGRRKLA